MGDEEGVEILEQGEKESRFGMTREGFLEKAFSTPASASIIFLLSVFIPLFGLFPSEITLSMTFAFSIPLIVLFLIGVVMNKEVGIRELLSKWFFLIIILSYVFYILSRSPWEPVQYYFYTAMFLIGFALSFLTYFIYYLFYLLSKRKGGMSYRIRILIVFVPTLIIMMGIVFILSNIVIGVADGEVFTLGRWLFEWGGSI